MVLPSTGKDLATFLGVAFFMLTTFFAVLAGFGSKPTLLIFNFTIFRALFAKSNRSHAAQNRTYGMCRVGITFDQSARFSCDLFAPKPASASFWMVSNGIDLRVVFLAAALDFISFPFK
jgi:hypothetical protein